jgi:hypothetical protein
MSELVDRVAEAIYDSHPQWGALWGKTPEIQKEYRASARAAISAMREPTDAMVEVAFDGTTFASAHRHEIANCWRIMTDEALK